MTIPAPKTELVIREAALALLARREHSVLELHHKLTRRGHESATVMAILQQLVAEGWLDERRYAEVYASARADKGYGPLRIERELRERGIDLAVIDSILAPLQDVWQSKLRQLCQRRFGQIPPKNVNERAKQQRFLRHRGFTFDQINQVFRRNEAEHQ